MSQIPVKLVTSTNAALHRLRQLMKTVHDEIRHRAFRLFQQRGCEEGHELEDWLEAESEVLCSPACEMAETADEVRIQAALPACPVKNLQVDVLPNSITIEGKAVRSQHRNGEKCVDGDYAEAATRQARFEKELLDKTSRLFRGLTRKKGLRRRRMQLAILAQF